MRKILSALFFAAIVFAGCKKSDGVTKAPEPAAVPLAASFTEADANSLKEGSAIQFKNTSTGAASYSWDFGNGQTSTEKEPSLVYPMCGIYNVKLVVSDKKGNKQTLAQDVVVNCIFINPNHNPLF